MENAENKTFTEGTLLRLCRNISAVISRDRYKVELYICLSLGILFGCITQSVYGGGAEWRGAVESYCAGFFPALRAIAPVTLGFVAAVFVAAPFEVTRLLIIPASVVRAMGLGALLSGAVQYGSLRELCFASLVLLPYAVINCVITVYAGEYALGLKESFTGENRGLMKKLILHTWKMLMHYLALAAMSCVVFAMSCWLFGIKLL